MMEVIHQRVLATFDYPVIFGTNVLSPDQNPLRDIIAGKAVLLPKRVLAVVDSGVADAFPTLLTELKTYAHAHRDVMELVGAPLVLPGGEHVKNDPAYIDRVHAAINQFGIDRHGYVLVIGGGALLDAAGYAAATAHRGIRLIRMPTTVLSQNDSGIGVKNSINRFGKKNFLGTFAPPFAILNDERFLTTLEFRDWISGVSEAIKVGLLKDASLFDFIEAHAETLVNRDLNTMREVVYRCAALHLTHIATSGDPFEMGSSRPLDFGHWAAHKLEQLTDYEVRHGEAVAIGLALDSTYAHLKGLLSHTDWLRILNTFRALHLKVYHPQMSQHLDQPTHTRCILTGLEEFREHLGGQLTVMLLSEIGRGFESNEIDLPVMIRSIDVLRQIDTLPQQQQLNGSLSQHLSASTEATR